VATRRRGRIVIMPDFDFAIIGAGAAGLSVAAVTAQLGLRVALIEQSRMGGECLHTGCVPSKALLAAAHTAAALADAPRFGIHPGSLAVDWHGVQRHLSDVIAAIAPMDSAERFQAMGAEVLRGHARFTAKDRLSVDGRVLAARYYVIAAGSHPALPALVGLESVSFLTNETVFSLTERPEHLLIIGGGAAGLEMAQAFAGLGSKVTLFEAGRVAPREDAELAQALARVLARQGVYLIEHADIARVMPGPCVELSGGIRIAGSHLLIATGRAPNLDGLGLDLASIATSPRGIVTDLGLRSPTNRRVFAAGDIADPVGLGPRWFTHVGNYHAGIIVRRAVFHLPARLDYRTLPRVIFTDPELAQVGMTEEEARAQGQKIQILHANLSENDRAVTEGDREGLVKLVVSPRGRLLGAGILARNAGEMIGLWGLAIGEGIPLARLAQMILPYPTRQEAAKRAVLSALAPRLFSPAVRRLARWLTRLP
jgi:pyruvate/2-oxoglutarate dehydrogenase complex dihydrolipoamide dehydrogenase (E3) component